MSLTRKQKQMVGEALGDGSDWPKFMPDPRVNHRVDQIVAKQFFPDDPDEWLPDWDDLSEEERQLYYDEVEAGRQ